MVMTLALLYWRFMQVIFYNNREQLSFLLGISYLWYTLIGFLIALIVGTLVSFATGAQDPSKLDPRLVWPFLRQRVGIKRVWPVILDPP